MAIAEHWYQEVEDYQKSGMRQKDWCKARGIPTGTFCYRLKKIRQNKAAETFFELKCKPSSIKIQWKELVLEIDAEFDERALSRLLQVITKIP